MVGRGGFADDVEAGVGLGADEVRVEGAELAGAEKGEGAGGLVVRSPVETLEVLGDWFDLCLGRKRGVCVKGAWVEGGRGGRM